MSIKLPRHVKIGPIMFSVQRVKTVGRKAATWGNSSYRRAAIKIKSAMPVQHQAVTLMHEICHPLLVDMGRNDLADDESFVEKLSENLMDTLWNSPGLLRYLKETKKA